MLIPKEIKTMPGVLKGWAQIAGFLQISISQALRYQKERGLLVAYIGRTPITTSRLVELWIMHQKKGINPSKIGPKERDAANQGR